MSKPVSIQPSATHHLNSVFTPLSGENVLNMYECEQGCSACCGPKAFVAVTSNRVITRHQGANRCIFCCEGPHVDTAIYLRDIEVLTEYKGPLNFCHLFFIKRLCGDLPKQISVKGGFGAEVLTFKRSEAIPAVNELAALIQPFKDR